MDTGGPVPGSEHCESGDGSAVPAESTEGGWIVENAHERAAVVGDCLEHWAAERPLATAQVFLTHERREVRRSELSYGELEAWTRAVAACLMEHGTRGDRVAILCPPGLAYAAAFIGALRSGLVGVPLFAPGLPGHDARLENVIADCAPAVILTVADAEGAVVEMLHAVGLHEAVAVVCVDALRGDDAAGYERPDIRPEHVAYLQYTSGSTRAPAGVMLTHENLMANARQLVAAFEPVVAGTERQAAVSWLPLFHDMGLVLALAMPLVVGCAGVTFDPLAFIQRPIRWLEALSGWDRVFSAAPNFAFGLAARRVRDDELAALDLTGVHAILNGAEPVTIGAVEAFTERFRACGLRPQAVRPAYGLAEATVFVAATPPGARATALPVSTGALQRHRIERAADGEPATDVVAHGRAWGQELIVVDPDTHALLDDGCVGELWVRGPNVGAGYWGREDESLMTFGAELRDPPERLGGTWLRTGDLGAVFDGQLYITGRRKDVVVVDGRNVYPQDIEHTVEASHPVIAAHRSAAFGVRDGALGEALVVVAEVHRDAPSDDASRLAARWAAIEAVSAQHAVRVSDVVLVGPHTVPRTSSGKIARAATRDLFLRGALDGFDAA